MFQYRNKNSRMWLITRTNENGEVVITYRTVNNRDKDKVLQWYKIAYPSSRVIKLEPIEVTTNETQRTT